MPVDMENMQSGLLFSMTCNGLNQASTFASCLIQSLGNHQLCMVMFDAQLKLAHAMALDRATLNAQRFRDPQSAARMQLSAM